MEHTVYIRLRHRLQVRPNTAIHLEDIAQIIADEELFSVLRRLKMHQVIEEDNNIIIIDIMKVIKLIKNQFQMLEIQTIGPSQVIVEVARKKRKTSMSLFVLVWLLLFFGAALTIMNFHEDVSMREVHLKIFTIITGIEDEKPLVFQVPYSIGLGAGMIIFFNHLFKKRLNEEPSPLEVEMFNYQLDLDNYVAMNENKESMKNIDDD
ncbi:stage V sporulation protein AA [Cytobacillus gottheilii]|uniref:Stage V sporulation protein AA n=1 Tax=Cytobacillus gottheilii TaxID=859144 RepID=A0ABX8F7C8_9BACI|nr:stage V sporulation protein AA [Cytobacillus gottheilii]QVY60226.1 stage V sporulation protein AA [Cytobacillus gottheilii]